MNWKPPASEAALNIGACHSFHRPPVRVKVPRMSLSREDALGNWQKQLQSTGRDSAQGSRPFLFQGNKKARQGKLPTGLVLIMLPRSQPPKRQHGNQHNHKTYRLHVRPPLMICALNTLVKLQVFSDDLVEGLSVISSMFPPCESEHPT